MGTKRAGVRGATWFSDLNKSKRWLLLVLEMKHEGYSEAQIKEMLPEKKKNLSQAILEELESRKQEDTLTQEEIIT